LISHSKMDLFLTKHNTYHSMGFDIGFIMNKKENDIKMKKYEVIETKEMLRCEMIDNYFALYEKTECKEFGIVNNTVVEKGCSLEKTVTILKGNDESTLQIVKSYSVKAPDLSEIRDKIIQDYPELFKKVNLTKQAV